MLQGANRRPCSSTSLLGTCSRGPVTCRRRTVFASLLSDAPVETAVRETLDAVAKEVDIPAEPIPRSSLRYLPAEHARSRAPVTLAMLNDVRTMYASLLKEYAYWVDDAWVTGTIPPELCGTYFRNGPALHVTNPRYQRHTLDGDGMVFSVAFKDGKAYFRNRYVRTKGFVEEQAAGRPLHRNSFTRGAVDGGLCFNPFDLSFKNVANTNVLPWAGKLYALWEAGLPYLMDPRSLDTLGESRMGGQIRSSTFSAHYRIVTEPNSPGPQKPPQQQHHAQQLQQQHSGPRVAAAQHWEQEPATVLQNIPEQHHLQREQQPAGFPQSHAGRPQHSNNPSAKHHVNHSQGPRANGHAYPELPSRHAQPSQGQTPPPPGTFFSQRFEREHVGWAANLPVPEAGATGASSSTATCRRLVTFSNDYGLGGARAVFYEFEESGRLLHETVHKLPGVDLAVIHDMAVTEHYYVLLVGPVKLDPIKFGTQYLLGSCSIAECLVFDERQPARIMFFPRPGRPSKKVLTPRVLTADPFFVFHNVNGFEVEALEGGGRDGDVVVLDTVAWDEVTFDLTLFDKEAKKAHLDDFVGGARAHLTRLVCDLRTGRVDRYKLLQRTVEFPMTDPRVAGRPHRVAWFITDAVNDPVLWGPAQAILRVEVDPTIGLRPPAPPTRDGPAYTLPLAAQHSHHQAAPSRHSSQLAAAEPPLRLAPPRPAAAAARGAAAGVAPGVAVDQWHFGERCFPGEPMFVPRPGSDCEGDGWLIVGVHDASTEKGTIHIFEAENLSAGPVASLHLPHRLPLSLHGAWDSTYLGPEPADTAVPRWREMGSVRPL